MPSTVKPRSKPPAAAAAPAAPAKAQPAKPATRRKPRRLPPAASSWRARVRMYRHGLGDCFLLSFARPAAAPLQLLIDCGALSRDKQAMTGLVERIRDHVAADAVAAGVALPAGGKVRLDVVIATHEHLDHVSGFNQARPVFEAAFEFGAVWMAWTEDTANPDVARLKQVRARALSGLQALVAHAGRPGPGVGPAMAETAAQVADLLGFSVNDDTVGTGTVAEAMAYLKQRGRAAGDLRYLKPGGAPFPLPGAAPSNPVRAYVLGPPTDTAMFRISTITEQMKRDEVVYHLSAAGPAAIDALAAALPGAADADADIRQPFGPMHRITRAMLDQAGADMQPYPGREALRALLAASYDPADQAWRRVDDDWLSAFGQLALNLDNDTNNTSLVLAFELTDHSPGDVLLFVADAQIGSWLSWRDMRFTLPERGQASTADLLQRTVFYKVGHHSSHNATAKAGGLERMTSDRLVAFIPLDKLTASRKGKKGWDMPAAPLLKGLLARTGGRTVISDVNDALSPEAKAAGVVATPTHIDYFVV